MIQPKLMNINTTINITNNTKPRQPFQVNIKSTYNSNNYNEIMSVYNKSLINYKYDLINYFKMKYNYAFINETILIDYWKIK